MAFQILPGSSRSADIGSSLATGLGGLLSNLAQKKAQQMQQVQSFQQFQNAGLTPEDARLISYFSGAPEIQAKLLSSLFERGGNPQQSALDMQSAMQELPNATQQPQQMAPQGGLQALSQLQPGMLGGGLQALMPQLQAMQSQQAQPQVGQQQAPVFGQPQGQQPQAQQPGKSSFYQPPRKEQRAEQQDIERRNAPFVKGLREDYTIAKKLNSLAKEVDGLLKTGKVDSGLTGAFKPEYIQNAETQQFIAKTNEIAGLLAAAGKGVATNFKIKLAQQTKPNVSQRAATQKALTEELIKRTEKPIDSYETYQQIIDENRGLEPSNLENLVQKRLKSEKSQQVEGLPNPSEYLDGDVWQTDDGKLFELSAGQWKPYKGKL